MPPGHHPHRVHEKGVHRRRVEPPAGIDPVRGALDGVHGAPRAATEGVHDSPRESGASAGARIGTLPRPRRESRGENVDRPEKVERKVVRQHQPHVRRREREARAPPALREPLPQQPPRSTDVSAVAASLAPRAHPRLGVERPREKRGGVDGVLTGVDRGPRGASRLDVLAEGVAMVRNLATAEPPRAKVRAIAAVQRRPRQVDRIRRGIKPYSRRVVPEHLRGESAGELHGIVPRVSERVNEREVFADDAPQVLPNLSRRLPGPPFSFPFPPQRGGPSVGRFIAVPFIAVIVLRGAVYVTVNRVVAHADAPGPLLVEERGVIFRLRHAHRGGVIVEPPGRRVIPGEMRLEAVGHRPHPLANLGDLAHARGGPVAVARDSQLGLPRGLDHGRVVLAALVVHRRAPDKVAVSLGDVPLAPHAPAEHEPGVDEPVAAPQLRGSLEVRQRRGQISLHLVAVEVEVAQAVERVRAAPVGGGVVVVHSLGGVLRSSLTLQGHLSHAHGSEQRPLVVRALVVPQRAFKVTRHAKVAPVMRIAHGEHRPRISEFRRLPQEHHPVVALALVVAPLVRNPLEQLQALHPRLTPGLGVLLVRPGRGVKEVIEGDGARRLRITYGMSYRMPQPVRSLGPHVREELGTSRELRPSLPEGRGREPVVVRAFGLAPPVDGAVPGVVHGGEDEPSG
mmetsp:Transcript_11926/g.47897  ORF Transcript_11926/g.47897 Transcript_11926/m.47897 type:complete len:681 (-) Transcript_11926:2641-4683(-)